MSLVQSARPGRNDPCPCGSRRKFKLCCGAPLARPQRKATSVPSQAVEAEKLLEQAARLRDAGRLAESIAPLQRAIQLAPTNAAACHDLGLTCLNCGRLPEAVASLRRAIALQPGFAHAHLNLGRALQQLGQFHPAAAVLRRAVSLAPKLGHAHHRLAEVLLSLGDDDAAALGFERAAAVAPDPVSRRLSLAKAAEARRRWSEAETFLNQALALGADACDVHRALGEVMSHAGRFDAAIEHFAQAIAIDPTQVNACIGIVSAKRVSEQDRPLLRRMEALAETTQSLPHRMRLHFAIGKAMDDLGDYAGAMRHYDAANGMRRSLGRLDRAEWSSHVAGIISRYTTEFFNAHSGAGIDDETPVLVIGMPRSGSTLLEQIISSHPQVAAGGEIPFLGNYVTERGESDDMAAEELATGYLRVLRGLSESATRIVDKMPYNFRWLGPFHAAFPRGRVIHLRRNPVDTCLSIYATPFVAHQPYTADRGDLVFYYRQYARLMEHWRSVLPPDRLTEIDYEVLVADREAAARRLIAFCGLPWDDACLRHEENKRVVKTASMWQARQPVYRSSVSRWRNYEPWLGELRELLPPEDQGPA
jgi:tetratricopeptide (TPR) repeat protein